RTLVLVRDEDGNPMEGARVYHNCLEVGPTDADGATWVNDLALGDRICARYLIDETGTERPNRMWGSVEGEDWAWRTWLTSIDIHNDGGFYDYYVNDLTNPYYLIIRKRNVLKGYNLVASVLWDASEAYLNDLVTGFHHASDFLYNATDGQFYFEHVSIRDCGDQWDYADFHFGFDVWPNARVGGLMEYDSSAQIRMPQFFDGNHTYRGSYIHRAAYSTLIHEFGHYGFGLYDEYFVYHDGEKVDAQCTHNAYDPSSPYRLERDLAASLMDNQYGAEEFCSNISVNPHNTDTDQHTEHGVCCWDWIKSAHHSSTGLWELRTPEDRFGVVPGPFAIPCDAWRKVEIGYDGDTGACDYLLTVLDDEENPIEDAVVIIWIRGGFFPFILGLTNRNGEISMLGAHDGDEAMIYKFVEVLDPGEAEGEGELVETFSARIELTCPAGGTGKSAAARKDIVENPYEVLRSSSTQVSIQSSPYAVRVFAEPGETSSTLKIDVITTAVLIEPPVVFVWQGEQDINPPFIPPMIFEPETNSWHADVQMDPAHEPGGIIIADTEDIYRVKSTGVRIFDFIVVPTSGTLNWESRRGDIQFHARHDSFPEDAILVIEPCAFPAKWDKDMVLVKGPYRFSINGDRAMQGKASLSLRFSMDGDEGGYTNLAEMAIYRWDEIQAEWTPFPSLYLPKWNEFSATIDTTGVYILAAPYFVPKATGVLMY
ncbi:MAG TPA: hypothetical protein PLB62_10655, partial [Candidatus Sumerlaeota bacterium]|nr:hypothetical protein [Candidatus Sumerlaeota bacterium]